MKKNRTDEHIDNYCAMHGIKLLIDPKLDKDDGLCYPAYNEIHLSRQYTSGKIKLAVFFHEVGHFRCEKRKSQPYNIFECEMQAWDYGMKLYKKIFGKSFSKSQAEFMLKCLKTYCRSQYEFKKQKEI